VIGVPRDWCVCVAGGGRVELRRGVWRTALEELEVRTWIDSIDYIKRREERGNSWVDWSKAKLSAQGARAISRYIGSGTPLRFWRKHGLAGGGPVIDGELYEQEGLMGVMVFHADRPDWWIPILNNGGKRWHQGGNNKGL
jgi:hypothetical protein